MSLVKFKAKAHPQHIGPNERPRFGACLLIWGLDDRPAPQAPVLFDDEETTS